MRDGEETEKLGLYLPPEKARQFHHAVAQVLFVSTRVRRDVQTAVAFLTTRVKKPDKDDWGKLKRLLRYLRATRHMKLRLSIDNVSFIKWWVDASYNVHWDCKGHTGAMMSLGKGATISFSHKHKLNVRSSTEGELVSIYDALPAILWTRFFIEAQGYTVEENVLFQDNKSTIQLANNGRWSSSKRTKHIKARYFYIKDRIEQGDVSIKWAPTDKMWSDVLTKPKQGKGFRQDRSVLMNCDEDYNDEEERLRTNKAVLPKQEGPVDADTVAGVVPLKQQGSSPLLLRRSVLGKVHSGTNVTWNASHNRADGYVEKARTRHVEVVVARILHERNRATIKRPMGIEYL